MAQRQPEIGARIKQVIKGAGDSYYDAGDKLGVSQTAIWKMTRGDFSRQMLEKFIEVYALDRAEWLREAGYETETWEQRLGRGLVELKQEFPDLAVEVPDVEPLDEEPVTIEQVEEVLSDIRQQLLQLRAEKQAGN